VGRGFAGKKADVGGKKGKSGFAAEILKMGGKRGSFRRRRI